MLARSEFLDIVRLTPLVSIDLVVVDSQGRALLGRRVNRPAQGTWFVPGGRIRKDETLARAFARLVHDELGLDDIPMSRAQLLGVYEHLYADNFAGEPGITTHYVVLGYRLTLDDGTIPARFEQHSDYVWMAQDDLLAHDDVHENTKAYFRA